MVLEACVRNGGTVNKEVYASVESVTLHETSALRHKNRGRAMTANRYKKTTGKTPNPGDVFQRVMRNGSVKEYVKVVFKVDRLHKKSNLHAAHRLPNKQYCQNEGMNQKQEHGQTS